MSFNIKLQGEQVSSISNSTATGRKSSQNDSEFSKVLNNHTNKGTVSKAGKQVELTATSLQRRSLHFSVNDNSGDIMVEIIDKDTDEVVRIIPHREMEQFIKSVQSQTGSFINTEV